MGSAKIYRLPGAARPAGEWSLYDHGEEPLLIWSCYPRSAVPEALLAATLLLAFLYLSGAMGMARHDVVYGAVLAGFWAAVFGWDRLMESRLGPLLAQELRFLGMVGSMAFLAAVYWIVLGR